jgi:hypothetical protein
LGVRVLDLGLWVSSPERVGRETQQDSEGEGGRGVEGDTFEGNTFARGLAEGGRGLRD